MLTEYILTAIGRAHYELMEDGRFFSSIKELPGIWADGDSLEECRNNLQDVLEDWIFVSISEKMPIPEIDGVKIASNPELARVDA